MEFLVNIRRMYGCKTFCIAYLIRFPISNEYLIILEDNNNFHIKAVNCLVANEGSIGEIACRSSGRKIFGSKAVI